MAAGRGRPPKIKEEDLYKEFDEQEEFVSVDDEFFDSDDVIGGRRRLSGDEVDYFAGFDNQED